MNRFAVDGRREKGTPLHKVTVKEQGQLLTLETPQLGMFGTIGKKALYITCVKVSHLHQLSGLASTKRKDLFSTVDSIRGRWWCLYKPPLDKRAADLQKTDNYDELNQKKRYR